MFVILSIYLVWLGHEMITYLPYMEGKAMVCAIIINQ